MLYRLERLETLPVPKFAAGLDLNPSHSGEMTVAPYHSTIESEVVIGPGVLRRSERLLNKPKVDYRQVALQPRWPTSTAVSSDSGQIPTLNPSSSSVALQQHANPSPFETVPATPVEGAERNRSVQLDYICTRQRIVETGGGIFDGQPRVFSPWIMMMMKYELLSISFYFLHHKPCEGELSAFFIAAKFLPMQHRTSAVNGRQSPSCGVACE